MPSGRPSSASVEVRSNTAMSASLSSSSSSALTPISRRNIALASADLLPLNSATSHACSGPERPHTSKYQPAIWTSGVVCANAVKQLAPAAGAGVSLVQMSTVPPISPPTGIVESRPWHWPSK